MPNSKLVLIPGLLCDQSIWKHQIEALADVADIFVPDIAAFDSITMMAESVLDSISGRFNVAGHSMGGRVALELVRLASNRVAKLALLNTGYTPRVEGEAKKRQDFIDLAKKDGIEKLVNQWIPPLIYGSEKEKAAILEQFLLMAGNSSIKVFENHIVALLNRPDATDVLSQIQCPTILICGRQDPQSPLSRHEEMQEIIPGGELVVIENCGHIVMLERPDELNTALKKWLQDGS